MPAREVFCLASGPSMTASDAESVRRWRAAAADREVYVVNTTFRLAPWADVLYAMDRAWWNLHKAELLATFKGEKVSPSRQDPELGVTQLQRGAFHHYSNSGAGAIALAIYRGVERIHLLGYDCQRTGGKAHWHGDHPKQLGNAASIGRWAKFFTQVAAFAKLRSVAVINCSRQTALKDFDRRAIEEVIPTFAGESARREAA